MVTSAQETLSYRNAALEDFLLRQQAEMQQRRYAMPDAPDDVVQHLRQSAQNSVGPLGPVPSSYTSHIVAVSVQ